MSHLSVKLALTTYWKKSKADKITDDLTTLKNQEKKRKIAIRDLKEHIHKLEHDIAHPPETEDLEKIADDFVRI